MARPSAGWSIARATVKKKVETAAKAVSPVVADAMAHWADGTVGQMKAIVPVRRGDLKDATDWTFGDAPPNAKFVVTAHKATLSGTYLRITLFSGSFKAFYAWFVERGTKARAPGRYRDEHGRKRNAGKRGHAATKAEPYFWPVVRANSKAGYAVIVKATNHALKLIMGSQ